MEPEKVLEGIRGALGDGAGTALSEIGHDQGGADPFKVLIGTILSHRTRDERTAEATVRLFGRFREPAELAAASREEVVEAIRGVGFYNTKSLRVIEVARIIRDRYGGVVPDSMDELLELPSVGRKTANCVLVYGFGKSAIPVDTHVHRISNRLGIANTRDPDRTEAALRKFFPKERWLEVNDLFVRFGKSICKPVGPRCGVCPLAVGCRHYNEVVKKK